MIRPSLSSGEETIQEILGQDVPHESEDQDRLALYLRALLQAQMRQAAATADEVARAHVFETYREPMRPNTLRRQRADIACFMRFLDEAGVPMTETCEKFGTHMYLEPELWQHVTYGLVLGFRKWQLLEGYTIESVNAHLSTVKIYARLACTARFLPAEELIYINLVRRVRARDAEQIDEQRKRTRRGAKKAEPTYLEAEHLQHLFTSRPQTEQGWRDLLALRLLYDMALRPSEAITRTIGDLDLARGTIAVYRKKTRLKQHLPLSKGTMVALTN